MSSTARAAPRHRAKRLAPEVRREQILDVALDVVLEDGFGAISMEGVARAAGIAKTVVYDAFGDQAGLLRALLEREDARVMAEVAAVIPSAPLDSDVKTIALEGIRGCLRAVRARPKSWRLFLLPPDGTPPALRRMVRKREKEILARIEPLVASVLARNPTLAALDVDLVCRAVLGLSESAAGLVLEHPKRYPPERLSEFAAELLVLAP